MKCIYLNCQKQEKWSSDITYLTSKGKQYEAVWVRTNNFIQLHRSVMIMVWWSFFEVICEVSMHESSSCLLTPTFCLMLRLVTRLTHVISIRTGSCQSLNQYTYYNVPTLKEHVNACGPLLDPVPHEWPAHNANERHTKSLSVCVIKAD